MSKVNVAVIYYSMTGTNYRLAQAAVEGAKEFGAEARLLRVPETAPPEAIASNPAWKAHYEATKDAVSEVTHADLEWADAIVFSMPTRFGGMPGQVKQFLDTTGGLWFQGKLTNKIVSAMTSAQNAHGGQEAALLSLYTTFYHWGAIIAAPGYTDPVTFAAGGNPYGTSVTSKESGEIDNEAVQAAKYQARRTAQIASYIKAGQGR